MLFLACLLSHGIMAQTVTSDSEGKAQLLLSFVDKLNMTTSAALSGSGQLGSANYTLAEQQYLKGNDLAVQARSFLSLGNYDAAISSSAEALKALEKALAVSSEIACTTLTDKAAVAEKVLSLKSEIGRDNEYLSLVENLTIQAKNAGVNVSSLSDLVEDAEVILENATDNLSVDVDNASQFLATARQLLNEIAPLQGGLSIQLQAARASQYVANAEQRVQVLQQNLTSACSVLPSAVQSASASSLNEAKLSLTAAKAYLQQGNINQTIAALVNFRSQEVQTINTLQAAGVAIPPQLTSSSAATAVNVPSSTSSPGTNSTTANSAAINNTVTPGSTKVPNTASNVTAGNARNTP